MTPNKFKEFVKEECSQHNVRFKAVNAKSIEGCSGYFLEVDDHPRFKAELIIAIGIPEKEWLPILAHEYCHLLQWKNKVKVWTNLDYPEGINSSGEVWHWLDHPYSKVKKIEEHLRNVRVMELNCERRSVNLITKFGLDVDLEEYKRKAFSYIHFYNYLPLYRKCPKRRYMPYSFKEVWSQCPASLNGSFEKAPKYYIDLLNSYCF